MTIGSRIRNARSTMQMTQKDLAEILGISVQAVSQWEGDKTMPTGDHLVRLGSVLGIDLVPGRGTGNPVRAEDAHLRVPLLSRVAAGNWSEAMTSEGMPSYEVHWLPKGTAFALEIHGGSMLPEFDDGDLVFVDTGIDPLPGDYVVAALNGQAEATFKKYRPRGDDENGDPIIELAPLNPDYPTLVISARNPGQIVGTMMEHRRFRRRR